MDISERLSIDEMDNDGDFCLTFDVDEFRYHYLRKEEAIKLAHFILEEVERHG